MPSKEELRKFKAKMHARNLKIEKMKVEGRGIKIRAESYLGFKLDDVETDKMCEAWFEAQRLMSFPEFLSWRYHVKINEEEVLPIRLGGSN